MEGEEDDHAFAANINLREALDAYRLSSNSPSTHIGEVLLRKRPVLGSCSRRPLSRTCLG